MEISLDLLEKQIDKLKKFKEESDNFNKNFSMLSEDAGFVTLGFQLYEDYIDFLINLFDDKDRWIDWFIFENKYGENEFEAGYDKAVNKVKTVKDLWNLIAIEKTRRSKESKND